MELDELKKQLNQRMVAMPVERSEKDISSLLQASTLSVIQKLRRSLWIEFALVAAFTLLSAILVLTRSAWIYDFIFGLFGVLGIAFMIIIYVLIRKTKAVTVHLPVKQNVEGLLIVTRQYIRRYLQFTMVMMPLCFAFAAWLSYNDPGKVPKPVDWETIGYLSIGLVASMVAAYYFTRWYLHRMYGAYVRQLEIFAGELGES